MVCVLAKEPRPGFAKTRLCPPCTPEQAADLAEACLRDTLATVAVTPATGRLVVLDGAIGPWLPPGLDTVAQVGGPLGARLAAAVDEAFTRCPAGPVVVLGMDTPQVTVADLVHIGGLLGGLARGRDRSGPPDAVLGPATDGGFWVIGLRRPVPGAFDGVPMSTPVTGSAQARRLRRSGCRVVATRELTDVDDLASARAVAAAAPDTRFARTLARMGPAAGW